MVNLMFLRISLAAALAVVIMAASLAGLRAGRQSAGKAQAQAELTCVIQAVSDVADIPAGLERWRAFEAATAQCPGEVQ